MYSVTVYVLGPLHYVPIHVHDCTYVSKEITQVTSHCTFQCIIIVIVCSCTDCQQVPQATQLQLPQGSVGRTTVHSDIPAEQDMESSAIQEKKVSPSDCNYLARKVSATTTDVQAICTM